MYINFEIETDIVSMEKIVTKMVKLLDGLPYLTRKIGPNHIISSQKRSRSIIVFNKRKKKKTV